MEKKMRFPYKPSAQKLIVVASLSTALLCGLYAVPALAETTDTSAVSAPVVTTETTTTAENTSPTAAESSQPTSPAVPTTTTPTTNPTPAAPTENTTPTPQSSGWRQENGQFHYYKEDGTLVTNQWIKDDSGWHYVDASGNAVKGWYNTPNGKTWYFDPSTSHNAASIGETQIGGKSYYFDEGNGLLRNAWVSRSDGSWSWAEADGSFHSGWKQMPDGRWFYFDPEDTSHRMKVGAFQLPSGTYYVDVNNGMTANGWVNLPDGGKAWAEWTGAFASGWKQMPDGRWFYFDPEDTSHRMKVGVFQLPSGTYYVDVNNGMTANGWVHLSNGDWAWAEWTGAFASGWFNTPNGKTWYFDPTTNEHAALIGLQAINGSYYYFDLGYGLLRNQDITLPDGRTVHADASGVLNIKPTDTNNGRGGNVDGNNGGDNRDANNTPADDGSPIEPTRGNFSDRTSVLGSPLVTKEDLQRDFNKRVGSAYPAVYAEKGAATGTDFVNQLWQAAIDEGVRPELLYAQVMVETGNLRFGGAVLPEQCNFGGLGATGNGERGLSFDTVLKGLRAQALHLRAYAGYEPLTVDPSKARDVDPRYGSWILAKKANIIRKLAGTWAMDKNYAVKLVRVMNEL